MKTILSRSRRSSELRERCFRVRDFEFSQEQPCPESPQRTGLGMSRVPPFGLQGLDLADEDDGDARGDIPVVFGSSYAADGEDDGVAAAGTRPDSSSSEDEDEEVAFTHPQEVTTDEYDAVQTLLAQAKEAKKEAKQLALEKRTVEKQVKALTGLNEQLRAKVNDLQKKAEESQQAQLRQLVAANARIHASKGTGAGVNKEKQSELNDALQGAEDFLMEEELEEMGATTTRKKRGAVVRRGRCQKCTSRCMRCLHRWRHRMGASEIQSIESRYGQGVSAYFEFAQWIWCAKKLIMD
eukprot:SAG31_NODE_3754_length_3920_cov_2.925936_2_plen_296_part_00